MKRGEVWSVEFDPSINGSQNKGMSDQIMAADKARLKSRVGILSQKDMLAMEDAIKLHLSFSK
ncbi:hypothetical protein [Cysteiniphilum litorale]|uniref:hypothetical protein n=1 Tax=Cysteiniphilum litorale TaxID=2056700 RepID=UPI003F885155